MNSGTLFLISIACFVGAPAASAVALRRDRRRLSRFTSPAPFAGVFVLVVGAPASVGLRLNQRAASRLLPGGADPRDLLSLGGGGR